MDDIESIAAQFCLEGQLVHAAPLGKGHINDTYGLTCMTDRGRCRYVLQCINDRVFSDLPALMDNIRRVTEHIQHRLARQDSALASRQLVLIETRDGAAWCRDGQGRAWRIYTRIENALTYDTLETVEPAREAARMFGWFQNMLIDLPGPSLRETIRDFHNARKRLADFERVLDEDAHGRVSNAKPEIEFLLDNAKMCGVLVERVESGDIPVRLVHNDAKINNVMFDRCTHKGVCIIDLDTVMPGLSLYDFGDLVRTAGTTAREDERDVSKIAVDVHLFEALLRGFAEEVKDVLTSTEIEHLVFAAKLIAFEQFMRFLTDYLSGDTYYRICREGHNLDRSRAQMKLVQSISEQEEVLNKVVEKVFRSIE